MVPHTQTLHRIVHKLRRTAFLLSWLAKKKWRALIEEKCENLESQTGWNWC